MQLTPRDLLLKFAHVTQQDLFPHLASEVGAALATAFISKAILNLPTTRALIDRLRVDAALRQLCGWRSATAVPKECKFSRAFAEFAKTERDRRIGHIARDSTAIPARERFDELAKRQKSKRKSKRRKGAFSRAKASDRGTPSKGSAIRRSTPCSPTCRPVATLARKQTRKGTNSIGAGTNSIWTLPTGRFRSAPC